VARTNEQDGPQDLGDLLDRIEEASSGEDRITLEMIMDAMGSRSFGPILLLAGIITLMPLVGDIPGVPTMMAILVLLSAVQLLFRREGIWLPGWILDRSIEHGKLERGLEWARRPAGMLDRWLRPRIPWLLQGPGLWVVAVACITIAAAMPAMEFVPFSANTAGIALTAFGLALVTRDGVLALIALAVTVGGLVLVTWGLI
jgi:hypothetical protein